MMRVFLGVSVLDLYVGHHFQGQKVKGQLAGGGAYCGGLPHSLFIGLSFSDKFIQNIRCHILWQSTKFYRRYYKNEVSVFLWFTV